MKQFLFIAAFAALFNLSAHSENVLVGQAASEVVKGAEKVRFKDLSSIPAHIKFKETERIAFGSWQNWFLSTFFKTSPGISFTLIGEEHDKLGMSHYRYQQVSENYPLTFGIWIVHTLNNEVVSMNGDVFDQVLSFQPSLDEAAALQSALEAIGAETYKWELEVEENFIKWEQNDPSATFFPTGSLEIVNTDLTFKSVDLQLAWKFNIYAQKPLSRREIYVSASNGNILIENDLIHHADSNGIAITGYSGQQNIVADYTGTQFRLRETGRGNGIQTFDMNNGTNYGAATDFFDEDNFWSTTSINQYGTDAYWGTEMTYDYYFNNFGRNSIDNNGFVLRSYVHYDFNYANAFWDGSRMTYGDGGGGNSPFTALDIAGHEVSHGLTNFTSNLVYSYESGALNESFSDIFGASVEFDALGFSFGDWLMGEDLGFIIRNMANPNSQGDPDTYLGSNWYAGPNDNGGVHTNSGVQNFWYYLLVVGETGTNDLGDNYSVNGIGLENAGAIAFRNNTVYLTNSSQYADARYYAIESALDLFGPCSQEVISTANAWHAVGVGQPYPSGVVADFTSNSASACNVPHAVQFYNNSFNGASYLWNFGDGSTSTSFQPSHTYTSAGVYDVSLIVTSSCGADTSLLVDYIEVGSEAPCEFVLPNAGSLTETSCSGVLYDNGGLANNYLDGTNSTITIMPTNTGNITLTFVAFDLQFGGSTCYNDYVEVFDGPNLNSPSLGRFCGSNPPPASLTSNSGVITIKFYSNGAVNASGFRIDWDCNAISTGPIADFSSNLQETCNGNVDFYDLTQNGATSWAWDFGDGMTSTLQNPTHQYAVNGTYAVTLVSTNQFGSDSETKTTYITVDRPAMPDGEDSQICPGESTTLTVSGSGTKRWYDSQFGGTLLATGNSFTTPQVQVSTAYYVESIVAGTEQNGGAASYQMGPGSIEYITQGNTTPLYFNAYSDFLLHSIRVYATSAGNRTFLLRNSQGGTVATSTVFVNMGSQVVEVNFDVPQGNGYRISMAPGSLVDLAYNVSGADFPYEIPGLLSIYQSGGNNSLSEYYFFYDWKVQEYCVSDRKEIAASTGICTGIDEMNTEMTFQLFPNPSKDLVTATWSNELEVLSITVYDMHGQLVRKLPIAERSNSITIDGSDLSKGIYMIEVSTGSDRLLRRLILQ